MRGVAAHREEVGVEAADADGDWDFEKMVSADKFAKSGVRGKIKEIQRIS